MKSNYFRMLLTILLFSGLLFNSVLAGDKIKIHLQQPPPNKMPITSLWKLDIENTTKEAITIYLMGSASGDKQGQIVEGASKQFSVKPGKSTYGYDDFKSGSVNWKNKTVQEVIIRTGDVPSDNYTICVTAFYESGEVADREQCITHTVERTTETMIMLISPEDNYALQVTGVSDKGGGVDEEQMAALNNLMWSSPNVPSGGFSIKIVEIRSGQTPEEAINTNTAFFKQDGIKTTNLKYPRSAPRFTIGKKYAWQVSTESGASDVWSFNIESSEFMSSMIFKKLACTDTPGKYEFELEVRVTDATYSQFQIDLGDINITFSQPTATWTKTITDPLFWPLIFSSPYPVTKTIKGTITSSPAIILNELEFKVTLHYTSENGTAATKDHIVDTTAANNCNCCQNFVKKVDSLVVTESNGNYTLGGFLTAGPNPICKIKTEIVCFEYSFKPKHSPPDNCTTATCIWPSEKFGNFAGSPIPSSIGALQPTLTTINPYTYSREIIWKGTPTNVNHLPFYMNLLLPSLPQSLWDCCGDSIRMCIRFSFTDAVCITCDTVICFRFTRGPVSQPLLLGYNENTKENSTNYLPGAGSNSNEEIGTTKNMPIPSSGDWWFFGEYARLHFTSGGLIAETGNLNTWEGSSVISDISGNLRFYTDGRKLYDNSYNEVFTGMNGNPSTSQCGITIPFTDNTFAVVIPDFISQGQNHYESPYYLGDNTHYGVTFYHFSSTGSLMSGFPIYLIQTASASGHENQTTEKVTAVMNEAGNGYWLIAHGHDQNISQNYYAYPISRNNGTVGSEVISSTSIDYWGKGGGYMRASPNCNILGVGAGNSDIEILSIDRTNGQPNSGKITQIGVLSILHIPFDSLERRGLIYGIEFSPSGRYLYVVRTYNYNAIIRFDLQAGSGSIADIQNSGTIIISSTTTNSYIFGALSLGPDGNIYVARDQQTYISRIENPDSPTPPASLVDVSLATGSKCGLGLPNFSQCIVQPTPPDSGCVACCDSFVVNVQSSAVKMGLNWYVDSRLTTGPNNITEIKAAMVNFYINKQEGCERCVKPDAYLGTIFPAGSGPNSSQVSWLPPSGQWIQPKNTGGSWSLDVNSRELVWNSLVGTSLIARPKFNNERVVFRLLFPKVFNNTCCADTIRFCIRWSFTDIDCKTCDTLICYTITQHWDGSSNYQQKEIKQIDIEKEYNELKVPNNETQTGGKQKTDPLIENTGYYGETAGMVNVDVNNSTEVKLIVYDVKGKKIMRLYDNYMKEGKYAFDLNKYKLPDGVYFYKLINGSNAKYEKVLIANGCNSWNK